MKSQCCNRDITIAVSVRGRTIRHKVCSGCGKRCLNYNPNSPDADRYGYDPIKEVKKKFFGRELDK